MGIYCQENELAYYNDDFSFGKCGRNSTYTYDAATKTLLLDGTPYSNWRFPLKSGVSNLVIQHCNSLPFALFSYYKELESVKIDGDTVSIEAGFQHCPNLKSVTLGEGIMRIANAFEYCIGLSEINLPNSIIRMDGAFTHCTSLKNVIIPGKLQSIAGAFKECTSLTEVQLPDEITSIDSETFSGCTSLKKVVVGEKVMAIEYTAFDNCDQVSIYGYEDTYAQKKAEKMRIPFVSLGKKTYQIDYMFGDSDTVLYTEYLPYGAYYTLPSISVTGYEFNAWSESNESTVVGDKKIQGQYDKKNYLVQYMIEGKEVFRETLLYGNEIIDYRDSSTYREGYTLIWDKLGQKVVDNTIVTGTYQKNQYEVKFVDRGKTIKTVTVLHGETVTPPVIIRDGYTLDWDMGNFVVNSDGTYTAQWTKQSVGQTYEIDNVVYEISSTKSHTVSCVSILKYAANPEIKDSITIGTTVYNVTKVENASGNVKAKTIKIGKNVTSLYAGAFGNNTKLKKIIISSKKLKTISKSVFAKLKHNCTIVVPKSKYKAYKKLFSKAIKKSNKKVKLIKA